MFKRLIFSIFAMVACIGLMHAQTITIDGDFSDWHRLSSDQVAEAALEDGMGVTGLYAIKFCADADYLYFYMEFSPEIQEQEGDSGTVVSGNRIHYFDIFMDADGNESTGYDYSYQWTNSGSDILIEGSWTDNFANASIFAYSTQAENRTDWEWEELGNINDGVTSCDRVILNDGQGAIEGRITRSLLDTTLTFARVGVAAYNTQFSLTGVLPQQMVDATQGATIDAKMLEVPLYAGAPIDPDTTFIDPDTTSCEPQTYEVTYTVPEGEPFEYDGYYYTEDGTYQFTYVDVNGCDSIVLLTLFFEPDTTQVCEYSGICGDSLVWTLLCDGVLTIEGSGAMGDYKQGRTPWREYEYMIYEVILPAGITHVGTAAFTNCYNLEKVTCLATTPPSLGEEVFAAPTDSTYVRLFVPAASMQLYMADEDWASIGSIYPLDDAPEPDQNVVTIFGREVIITDSTGVTLEEVDLLGDSTILYRPEEHTLTFNAVSLEAGDSITAAINYTGTETLTIVLCDSSTIIADTVIASTADIVVTGEGYLVAEAVVPIVGAPTAGILFDSVSMYVRSLPSSAAVRRRIKGGKRLEENGGPALSGFASVDYNKTAVTPPEADYGEIDAAEVPGLTENINAMFVQNPDGTKTILTEFELTAIADYIDAVENVRTPHVLDVQRPMYNILGIQVGADYKGIVIQAGQTYLLR